MANPDNIDGTLFRKAIAIKEGINVGHLNPVWVEMMLQRIVEADRSGDFYLIKVWATVTHPDRDVWSRVLRQRGGYGADAFDGRAEEMIESLHPSLMVLSYVENIDLVVMGARGLYIDDRRKSPTEGEIIEAATSQGLLLCPDWVVFALALHATMNCSEPEKEKEFLQFNICLEADEGRGAGFAMFYRKKWKFYRRAVGRDTPWSGNPKWLFVKPKKDVLREVR